MIPSAYRCLPLTIANAAGWIIRCPAPFTATWYGGDEPDDLTLAFEEPWKSYGNHVLSHFGSGVITFSFPMLFRTESKISLRVSGLPNSPKPNVCPLEGVVETDWLPFTFTMNVKVMEAGTVRFVEDEPVCFLQPIGLDLLEAQEPIMKPLAGSLKRQYDAWADSRTKFNASGSDGWQKLYLNGGPPHHRTKLTLKSF